MDANYFGKCKASEMRVEINQAWKKVKPNARFKVVLKKALSNIILNKVELASLLNDIVPLFTLNDYEITRLCSHYITHYAIYNPKDAASALDFYRHFSESEDPLLRALSVKVVSSIPLKDFTNLGLEISEPMLKDTNPHVRTAAAFAVARLFQENQEKVVSSGLVRNLNMLLNDDNQNVVSNALAALDSITQSSTSHDLNINKEHLLLLTKGIGNANEWKQVYLLDALMSFVPQTSDDALEMTDAVLPCLAHENTAVVLHSVKLIVYLSNFIASPETVVPSLDKRLGAALVSLLYKPGEVQFLLLRNVILLLLGRRYLIHAEVEQFFWNFDDPVYIKDTKLEIIYLLANEDNMEVVFRELEEYATDVDVKMARKAIRAYGNLSIKLDAAALRCVALVADLLAENAPNVVQEATIVISNILRMFPKSFDSVLDSLIRHHERLVDTEAKVALAWILGQYPDKIAQIDQVLQNLCDLIDKETLPVQQAIMTSVVKFYVRYPLKGESLVLQVLKFATEESGNPDLRERGYFYWRMITHEKNSSSGADFQKFTREIVVDVKCLITPDAENIDPANLEELELNIGTLASVYLKSIKNVFRYSKPKSLPESPALQERRKTAPVTKNDLAECRIHRSVLLPFQKPSPFGNISPNRSSMSFNSVTSVHSDKKEGFKNKMVRRASSMMSKKNKY